MCTWDQRNCGDLYIDHTTTILCWCILEWNVQPAANDDFLGSPFCACSIVAVARRVDPNLITKTYNNQCILPPQPLSHRLLFCFNSIVFYKYYYFFFFAFANCSSVVRLITLHYTFNNIVFTIICIYIRTVYLPCPLRTPRNNTPTPPFACLIHYIIDNALIIVNHFLPLKHATFDSSCYYCCCCCCYFYSYYYYSIRA